MDGEVLLSRVNISDDNMYHELIKETNEVELDTSTQECLEMTCYSCALVRQSGRQLEDQLPVGKFYQPSEDILEKTKISE